MTVLYKKRNKIFNIKGVQMKRSEINIVIQDMLKLINEHKFYLPAFANWSALDYKNMGPEYNEIIDNKLGWDITDFGLSNFKEFGFSLFTIRNGNKNIQKYKKIYAEKLLMLYQGQKAAMHYHASKMEDIINRGGNNVYLTLYNAAKDGKMLDSDVIINMDGRESLVKAATQVCLSPGQSITLDTYTYHDFMVKNEGGSVLLGEISMCNDDDNDNFFYDKNVGRFPKIEEDEPPYRLLCNEYFS